MPARADPHSGRARDLRPRHGRQEFPGVLVPRVGEHLVGLTLFDDGTLEHHRDPMCQVLDHRQVVRDEQVGQPELFLQVKQAQASVLAPYVEQRLSFANQGQRVVVGQRLTQGSPDIFLGWGEVEGQNFYIRQLADMKGSIKFNEDDAKGVDEFVEYCGLCGWALALAHAKSGDAATISGYLGKGDPFDRALGDFALAYADQTERDHAALAAAVRDGRLEALVEE